MYLFKIIILLPTLRHLSRKINLLLPSHFAPVCLLTQNSNKGGLASSSVSSLSSTGVMSSRIGCTPKTVAPLSSSVSSLSSAGEMSSRLGGTSKTLASVTSSATWKKRIQTLSLSLCVCVCVWERERETKTCVYNFDPLKPHCYIVKLRFIGVYIIFLISAQNLKCVCVRSASPRQFERVPTIYVWSRNMKNIRIFIWFFFFFFHFLYNVVFIIIIFIISAQKHRLWYAFKPPRRVPTINVWSRNMKNIRIFYLTIFIFFFFFFFFFFDGKIFNIFE